MISCCRRSYKATNSPEEFADALQRNEHHLLSLESRIKSINAIEDLHHLLRVTYPLVVILVAISISVENDSYLRYGFLFIVVLLPLCSSIFIQYILARLKTLSLAAFEREEAVKKELLSKVKSQLPMEAALRLLLRFDENGNHKAFIEMPPHVEKELEKLKEEKRDLIELVNFLSNVILENTQGGYASARETLSPMKSLTAKFVAEVPSFAVLNQDEDVVSKLFISKTPSTKESRSILAPMDITGVKHDSDRSALLSLADDDADSSLAAAAKSLDSDLKSIQ
jgi:hypothetical protein